MIKLIYPLRRLPELSREEFHKYWYENHGPLVKKHAQTLRIRRYIQVHTLDDPINDRLQESRNGQDPYDGVAEIWWDSRQDMEQAFATPEGQKAHAELLEDEKKFIDLSRSSLWIANERPVIP